MIVKQLLGWCGHPVEYGTIICDGCRKEVNRQRASKKNKKNRRKVNA